EIYNHVRPHQAIGMVPPATRYRLSPRPFPERLDPITEYGPDDIVIGVDQRGRITLFKRPLVVSTALKGRLIAARPRPGQEGVYDLYFAHHWLDVVDLRLPR
ncbi:hypothetical protein EC912_1041, partial [Luteibacter rhizovicinus]